MIKGLKICGVSDPETLNYILNHNHKPTMIGFITNYKKSKRFVEFEKLKDLIHVNKKKVDALSQILHKDNAYKRSKELIENLKKLIPRQNFEITIQGCVGSKVLSSTSIRGYRKDVTAKLYGGDVTRKMKLLKKQKEGKKKMKKIGNVEIPREAFYKFLSTSD